ncbi:MAG TPA: hypothetical protein VN922_02380 [Bacteroidia bacterium]|nr:hypothetical protein [Bacteroidia bacterium]
MRKRFAFATVVVFVVATMITTIPDRFMLPSTAAAQEQQINSNTSSSLTTNSSSTNALPLKTIFKQVENSVVQITSKISITTGVPNPQNPPSSNADRPIVYRIDAIMTDTLSMHLHGLKS